jgi:diguanylate cyclase (GGDEF)-like protein
MSNLPPREKLSLRRSHITTAFAVVLLICQVLLFTWDFKRLNENIVQETIDNHVLERIRNIVDDLLDAETGQRGYLLTGNETYLAPYTTARAHVWLNFHYLKESVPPDALFQREVERLGILIDRKITELDRTVALRKHGEISAALAVVNLGYGKATMDEARKLTSDAMVRVRGARNISQAESAYRIRRASILLLVMGLTTAFLVIYGWRNMAKAATENDKLAERLGREAMLDVLTGLPNRRYFESWAAQSLRQAQRHSNSVGLVVFDLDGFKKVNDTLGHSTGDEVLQEASRRLRTTLRAGDFLARLGGDEFAAIVVGDTSRLGLTRLADRMISAMAPRMHPSLDDYSVGVSLGVAISTKGETLLPDLLESADEALYGSKREGRGRVSFAVDAS